MPSGIEHPATVLVVTNMLYSEAPWLTPHSVTSATSLVWHELPLTGTTAHEFETQIGELASFLAENWGVRASRVGGNPVYDAPADLEFAAALDANKVRTRVHYGLYQD